MLEERYQQLEEKISIKFKDLDLIDTAFVHKSYLNENRDKKTEHNERLEFLGDAVLELVVTEFLYKQFPEKNEGELTNWRSALVKGANLAIIAKDLNLGSYLYLSRGEELSNGREKDYILANTVECIIGAIYLDQGYEVSHQFIHKFVIDRLETILEKKLHIDAKSHFQELAQEKLNITPEYRLVSEEGPDHDKTFRMGAYLEEELIADGQGSSKQKAEQDAARNALKAKGWGELE